MAEVLALLGERVESRVRVQPSGAIGMLVIAGPLNRSGAQTVVGHPGVVARASSGRLLECVEALFWRRPRQQRRSIAAGEPKPRRVVQENVHVGPRLAGRLDRLLRQV